MVYFVDLETNSHTSFLSNWFNSSCMEIVQFSSFFTSWIFLGSIWEIKAKIMVNNFQGRSNSYTQDEWLIIWFCEWLMTNIQLLRRSWLESLCSCYGGGSVKGHFFSFGSTFSFFWWLAHVICSLLKNSSKPKSSLTFVLLSKVFRVFNKKKNHSCRGVHPY